MKLLTSLSKESRDFVSSISASNTRTPAFSIAVARALSMYFPIPSAPVENGGGSLIRSIDTSDDFGMYYGYNQLVCKMNELIILDMDLVKEYTEKFVRLRYRLVHGGPCNHLLREGNEVEDFFGLSDLLGDELFCSLRKETSLYNRVNMRLYNLAKELAEE